MHVMCCAAALRVICEQNIHWQQLYMFYRSSLCARCPFGSMSMLSDLFLLAALSHLAVRHFWILWRPKVCRACYQGIDFCGLLFNFICLLAQVYLDTCSRWDGFLGKKKKKTSWERVSKQCSWLHLNAHFFKTCFYVCMFFCGHLSAWEIK